MKERQVHYIVNPLSIILIVFLIISSFSTAGATQPTSSVQTANPLLRQQQDLLPPDPPDGNTETQTAKANATTQTSPLPIPKNPRSPVSQVSGSAPPVKLPSLATGVLEFVPPAEPDVVVADKQPIGSSKQPKPLVPSIQNVPSNSKKTRGFCRQMTAETNRLLAQTSCSPEKA